jgi:glutamate/tyrosine decarboxylase-like PLP-dependent enzyme
VRVTHTQSPYGYIELPLRSVLPKGHRLNAASGLHVWPRRHFVLIAQPNADATFTATLFLPLDGDRPNRPSFAQLRDAADVANFCANHFADIDLLHPEQTGPDVPVRPAQLKTIACSVFHAHRTLLLGDAAHTVLPFFGQGINCSFEDVRVLLTLLDRHADRHAWNSACISDALAEFTVTRQPQSGVIAELSHSNFAELATQLGRSRYRAQARIEHELSREHPEHYSTLYSGITFSSRPYDEVVRDWRPRQTRLDALCRRFDPRTEAQTIVSEYIRSAQLDADTRVDLSLTPTQQQTLLDAVVARLLQHESELRSGRIPASYVADSIDAAGYTSGREISNQLHEPHPPAKASSAEKVLTELFERAVPSGTTHPHPGFMAHVPSGGLLQGAAGTFIASALNRFAGVWLAAPGLVAIESNVIRWFCHLLGYRDERSFGYLTTSGSLANMFGLLCACRHDDDEHWPQQTIYVSEQGHYSIRKAARLIGVAASRVRVVPVRHDLTVDLHALSDAIDADRAMGLRPTCVVATAGTTNTGAVDDLKRVAALCEHESMWLHVDGCFGGFFRLTARGRVALEGIERADSIAVDGHKSLFLPHGNSALLVKDRADLVRTFDIPDAGYMPGSAEVEGLVDFCRHGPELSREIRGLAAWLPLKVHGVEAFARCLDERLNLADQLAVGLKQVPAIDVIEFHPRHLPVVVFRHRRSATPERASDRGLNRELCERVCARGRTYVTTTVLPGLGLVLRACILNHRTREQTIDDLLSDVRAVCEELRGGADAARAHRSA